MTRSRSNCLFTSLSLPKRVCARGVPEDGRGIDSVRVGLGWNTPAGNAPGIDNMRVFAGTDTRFEHGFKSW